MVGSAQRKLGNTILQHGSILCGSYHINIVNYLNTENLETLKKEINKTTIDLGTILNQTIDYERLAESIAEGFENNFNMKFERSLNSEPEIIQQ